ncbi:TPA: alpha/beta hydrolase, partial [Staphylococcus aureus]|nr:alpha/beta hydrolase [Staphylococcus aureus]
DPAVIEDYKKDPLNNKYMSLGMVKQMGVAQVYNTFNAPSFSEPTLIMHGANDGIVPSYFDVNWYNAIGSKDKKIIEWEGLMHETIN